MFIIQALMYLSVSVVYLDKLHDSWLLQQMMDHHDIELALIYLIIAILTWFKNRPS